MGEAERDGLGHALDVLVRIVGHDPATRGALDWERVGEPLHLHRVLDAHLLLGRERQRRPVAGVLQGAVSVGVE